ncbi:MAG: SDR family oxidoreductase [Anaerolineae bacterium]
MGRLQDRVAIVTGAAQGIGRALAEGLAGEGAAVVVADLQDEKAQAVAAAIEANGGRALGVAADVTRLADIDATVERAVAAYGRLDILVNNAGIGYARPFFEFTEADWDRTLAVNLKSAFFATQRAAAQMYRQPLRSPEQRMRGKIVNVASTSAFIASSTSMVPYDVSKAGVRMLTISAGQQLGPLGINVNAIAPATTNTDLVRALFDDTHMRAAGEKLPLGRVAEPEDMVGAVVFLCSDEADYITGHTLVVDGGRLIR